jgi:rhombotail lipoprotein
MQGFDMKRLATIVVLSSALALSGCAAFLGGGSRVRTGHTTSLVEFLYPAGALPPSNSIPELRVPLRVGLAFLPAKSGNNVAALDAQQKLELLERIRQRFSSRQFVSEIVVIPDYYLTTARGYSGLESVQRLYGVDLVALVSYDNVSRQDSNILSLGYLTIVGAYLLPGTSRQTSTLVDLAVVDPGTRSLVLRAGGASSSHGYSTQAAADYGVRRASAEGFAVATAQLIENFDAALINFEKEVRAGKANVRVVRRGGGGAGAFGMVDALVLTLLLAAVMWRRRSKECGMKYFSRD